MKKIFWAHAAAILLFTAFGLLSACSGAFSNPGWASETGLGGGGYDYDDDNGSGRKPSKLANNASYSQAVAKVDEIIAYCGNDSSLSIMKSGAQ